MLGGKRWSRHFLGLCMIVLLTPVGSAQDPYAPHPSTENNVLYAHGPDDSGSGNDELEGWMNTLADDGTDIAMGPQQSQTTLYGDRTYTLTLLPALNGELVLDGDGTIEVVAHLGAGSGNGLATVATKILYGETVVAEGEEQDHLYTQGGGAYPAVTWSLTPLVTQLPAGAELQWLVETGGTHTPLFLGVSEDRGRSRITLPIVSTTGYTLQPPPPPLEPIVDNLTGDAVELFVQYDNITTQSHTYSWFSNATNLTILYEAVVEEGSVTVDLEDGNGTTLYNLTLTGSLNGTDALEGLEWFEGTITLDFNLFRGSLLFKLTPPTPRIDPDMSAGQPHNDTHKDDSPESKGKSSPAPLPAFVLMALAILAVARHHRNRA